MATTATRPRGFPNLTMPATSSDRPQHSRTGGLPGSHLYANHDIWTSTMSAVHGRSMGAQASTSRKASNEDVPRQQPLRSRHSPSDDNAAGSSALNANSEADWSRPWNSEHLGRSVSTSPSRPRDGGRVGATGYFDQQTAAIGSRTGGFTNQPYHDNVFASTFSTVGRSAQDLSAYSVDAMTGYGHHREASLPPSRHSQNSPTYQDLYRASHTPNNSVSQSVRGASYTSQGQSLNQRAFNLNNRIDEEFSAQLNRRLALDSPSGPAASFNPPPQPFQLNPGTVPWNSGGNGLLFGAADVDLSAEGYAAQYAGVGRSPIERVPSGSGYRLDSGGNGRGYSDPWQARSAPRDARQGDVDRRAAAQHFASAYNGAFFPAHFPCAGFATNFVDVNQNFRQHPMIPPFGLPNLATGLSPAGGIVPATRRDQDPGKGIRSPLLEEFRTTHRSNRRWELKEIFNHVVEFSGDQHGSRFIQQKLETANSEEKEQVFCEIEPNAIQLMKDVFGNYVVQKFYEHGNQVQKKVLSDKMRGRAYDLSVQVYGCRVVQKALEHILVEQQAELTKELEPEILLVIKDQNGNHVVQKIIELVPRKHLDFVMSAMRGQTTGLASHTYGCRVVQRMLEHGTAADRLEIMTELHASAQILLTDQYGNYVAQHVIEHGKTEDRQKMIELVMSQLVTLSKHKFASNVVEKCIQFGSAANKATILNLLTATSGDGSSTLQQLMRDQYGNYVIQKLLGVLEGPNRDGLVEDIKSQLFALKKSGATKQLQALEKLLGDGSKDGFSAKNGSSARGTPPPLTNESSSPASSNPPSTRASTVGLPGAQFQDVTAAKADGDETPI